MHLSTLSSTLSSLLLSLSLYSTTITATPTPYPQGGGTTRNYIKLITVYDIDASVSGPTSQDIPSSTYMGFEDEIDRCWYYGYERFDYGHIEVGSGLTCDFYSQKECVGSHFTVVGTQRTARAGGKQPVFLSFRCEYLDDKRGGGGPGGPGGGGGKGKGKGKGKSGRGRL